MAITLIEVKNQVISHFMERNVFNMQLDAPKLTLDEDTEAFREPIVRSVLNDLEVIGMVRRVGSPEQDLWILTQSFDSFDQHVVISAPVADIIADLINSFRDENEITGDTCDKLKIKESDLLNLINICHILLNEPPPGSEDDEESEE